MRRGTRRKRWRRWPPTRHCRELKQKVESIFCSTLFKPFNLINCDTPANLVGFFWIRLIICRWIKILTSEVLWSWILVKILKLGLVNTLNFKFSRYGDVWLRLRSKSLVEILEMKFEQDLCLNLWYDPIGYFGKMNSTLGSVVPLAMFFFYLSAVSWFFSAFSCHVRRSWNHSTPEYCGNARPTEPQVGHEQCICEMIFN